MTDIKTLLDEFDTVSDDALHYERMMKLAAKRRGVLVRKMLELVTIEELSRITGLRIIRLRQLEAKR